MVNSRIQQRLVIVAAGFGGFNAARELSRRVGATTDIMVINSADYFLYLPVDAAGGRGANRGTCASRCAGSATAISLNVIRPCSCRGWWQQELTTRSC